MPVVALFGITNSGLNLFVNLVVLFLVVVWIALIAWTFLDARRRIKDPVLVAGAPGAAVLPRVGSIVLSKRKGSPPGLAQFAEAIQRS